MTATDPEPTAEQCSAKAPVTVDGRSGIACWYPQMGGYVGKCVILPDGEGGFDALVWHDGNFPFLGESDDDYRAQPPRRLHHCDPQQFIAFGELAETLAAWVMHQIRPDGVTEVIPCRMDADGTIHFTPTAVGTITGPHRAGDDP